MFDLNKNMCFLDPIELKIWDQAFLNLEIQKTESARPDSFQKLLLSEFSYRAPCQNFEWTENSPFFRVTRRAYDRWKGLDEIYNLRQVFCWSSFSKLFWDFSIKLSSNILIFPARSTGFGDRKSHHHHQQQQQHHQHHQHHPEGP